MSITTGMCDDSGVLQWAAVIERHATLVVRLELLAAVIHKDRRHAGDVWYRCPQDICRDTARVTGRLIEGGRTET